MQGPPGSGFPSPDSWISAQGPLFPPSKPPFCSRTGLALTSGYPPGVHFPLLQLRLAKGRLRAGFVERQAQKGVCGVHGDTSTHPHPRPWFAGFVPESPSVVGKERGMWGLPITPLLGLWGECLGSIINPSATPKHIFVEEEIWPKTTLFSAPCHCSASNNTQGYQEPLHLEEFGIKPSSGRLSSSHPSHLQTPEKYWRI